MKRPKSYEEALKKITSLKIQKIIFFVLGALFGSVGILLYIFEAGGF